MSRDVALFVDDMATALAKVGRYVHGCSQLDFEGDELRQSAVERELFIAGEAAKHIASDVRSLAPELDWRGMAGFRDILGHEYFGIDPEMLWEIASVHAPRALELVLELQTRLGSSA